MLEVDGIRDYLIIGENCPDWYRRAFGICSIESCDSIRGISFNVLILLSDLIFFNAIIELSIGGTAKLLWSNCYLFEILLQC